MSVSIRSAVFLLFLLTTPGVLYPTWAAGGFRATLQAGGQLEGEVFAPPDQTGWALGLAMTHIASAGPRTQRLPHELQSY